MHLVPKKKILQDTIVALIIFPVVMLRGRQMHTVSIHISNTLSFIDSMDMNKMQRQCM